MSSIFVQPLYQSTKTASRLPSAHSSLQAAWITRHPNRRQGHKNALRKSRTGQSGQVLFPQLPVLLSIVSSEIILFPSWCLCSVFCALRSVLFKSVLSGPACLQLLTAVPAHCIIQSLVSKLDCYPAILIAQLLEPLVATLTTLVKSAQAGAPNLEAALIRTIQPKPA